MSTKDAGEEAERTKPTASIGDGGAKAKTTLMPRQTYYVPEAMHRRLKILAIQSKRNVSDLVVEGIEYVLKKYE